MIIISVNVQGEIMVSVNPYLNFNGNCQEAFEFYRSVFGGDFPFLGRYKDMPADASYPVPEEAREKIMHMSLPLGNETALMGSDAVEQFGGKAVFGNNISLMINVETKSEADGIWARLSVGATLTMPLMDAFWGSYFGGLTDKFGVNWLIAAPSDKA